MARRDARYAAEKTKMNEALTVSRAARPLASLGRFLGGGAFPIFVFAVLFFYQVFLAIMVFAPPTGNAWGAFVEDFRIKCFRYDPRSGWMQWSYVWIMLAEPLLLQSLLVAFWKDPMREMLRRQWRTTCGVAGAALLTVTLLAGGLTRLGQAEIKADNLPFPAERLRTQLVMPQFSLTNQDGQAVALDDFKGRVVLVTAVYSTCTVTCPRLLQQVRQVLDQLAPAERADLAVIAFSLNPEQDTRELRAATVNLYGLSAPRFHFVNGVPSEVNALLDRLQVARERDAATGQISHGNLFFLIDRQGKIAYRLSLSEQHPSWLVSATRVLLAETAN